MRNNIVIKLFCDKHPKNELDVSTEPIPSKSELVGHDAGSAYEIRLNIRVLPCAICEHDKWELESVINKIELVKENHKK